MIQKVQSIISSGINTGKSIIVTGKTIIRKSDPTPAIKGNWKKFVKNFKPEYSIHVHMYHVIPGMPVSKKTDVHAFDKGEYEKAKTFYDKVIHKTNEIGFAPVEIVMVKGKKKVVSMQQFGPIEEIKQMSA
jgi:hypothetical protein